MTQPPPPNQRGLKLAVAVMLIIALVQLPHGYATTLTFTSDPDCVSRAPDRVDCFVRGQDNALWHVGWDAGTWSGWESLGGNLTSGPSATSSGPNRLDMFARGLDNGLWHVWWDGALHPWESLGGNVSTDPDCVSRTPYLLDCFAGSADKKLMQISFNGAAWSDWKSLGGVLDSGPGAASWGPNRLDIFVKSADKAMWQISWDGAVWSSWESRGGILASDPDCVSWGPNRIDCVVKGPDNGVWWKWYVGNGTSGTWSNGSCPACAGFEKLGGKAKSGPTITSRQINSLDAFAIGEDGRLYHKAWNGSTWSSGDVVPMTLAATTNQVTTLGPLTSTVSSAPSSASTTVPSVSSTFTQTSSLTQSTSTETPNLAGASNVPTGLQTTDLLVFGSIGLIAIVLIVIVIKRRGKSDGTTSAK